MLTAIATWAADAARSANAAMKEVVLVRGIANTLGNCEVFNFVKLILFFVCVRGKKEILCQPLFFNV